MFLLFTAILALPVIAGCSWKKDKEPAAALLIPPFSLYQTQIIDTSTPASNPNNFTTVPDLPSTTTVAGASNPQNQTFSSVSNAMDKLLSLKCPYIDSYGKKVVAFVKERKILINSNDPDDNKNKDSHILFKYNQAWIWNISAANGVTINLDTLPIDKSFKMGKTVIRSTADVINVLEEKKNNCEVADLSNDMFEPPQNIKFVGNAETSL